ncbi:autotransporter outer membrane beta-barrel domain-containing protein [Brevundimonas faecalis]|uniref:Outer membrane autotransporter protein n=1 Tax=Brevundimonas faecalis TaxID=947378 RepID=A0ABV2R8P4_9CAUL
MLSTAAATLVCICLGEVPAHAQSVVGSGNLSPGPVQTPTWAVDGDLLVGDAGNGQLDITAGGTVINDTGHIGYDTDGNGVVTVSGTDGGGNASTWTNRGDLFVGSGGTGTLNILAGGKVSSLGGIIGAGGAGEVLVSGPNSSWENSGRLSVGLFSAGTLRVEGGATISSADGVVGDGDRGEAVLTGPGTTWTNTGQFTVGSFGDGVLRVENGATVTSNQGYIGAGAGVTGEVTVTGAGSKWLMTPYSLTIGNFGTGSLTIEDGGLVRAEGGVLLGVDAGGGGTLLVKDLAGRRGVLETSGIRAGAGAVSVVFDGGLLRATRNNAAFFDNFGARSVVIGPNGVVIDTNGYDIGMSPSFSGAGALIKDGAGKLTLTGDSGRTFTGAGSVISGTLVVDGVLGGTMQVIGGRLQGIGTVGATIHQRGGTIAPGNGIGRLTINGDYLGNGGLLEIETVLGGDASSSDRLVITGATAGSTLVKVLNQGGAGAATVEGIKIVDVGGASNGDFTLQGDYVFQGRQAIVAGAYAYTLQKNGVSTPNDGDWYLRSAYLPSGTDPSKPTPVLPIYQPGVPIYEAYGQVLQSLNGLQTLRQRVGDNFDDQTVRNSAPGRAVWTRVDVAHRRSASGLSTSGADYEIGSWRIQAGAEGRVAANEAGVLVGGFTLHHDEAQADVGSVYGNGEIRTRGVGFGAALTWYGENGVYADLQGQATWFDSDLTSTTTGRRLAEEKAGFGYALGLEGGRRIARGGGWSLTPQAQLTYSRVDADSFVDPFGPHVRLDDGDSLRGRLGLSADYLRSRSEATARPSDVAFYGVANLYYEFLDGVTAFVADTAFTTREERLWGGLGLGARYGWGRYAVYGEVEGQTGLAHFADSHRVAGRAGFRVSW